MDDRCATAKFVMNGLCDELARVGIDPQLAIHS